MTVKYRNWDEVHVGDHMIQAQSNKSHGRPPDGYYLRHHLTRGDGDEDGEANEPVRSDAAKENLVPLWKETLTCREIDDGLSIAGN